MKISLKNLGKRYNREWIFRHLNHELINGRSYAITGPNGSGKSTLLQVIAGYSTISEGAVVYSKNDQILASDKVYSSIGFAAPYLELIEEMTLVEFLSFHQKLKPLIKALSIRELAEILSLETAMHKEIRYFSSGMKQRVKLGQAIFSDVPVIFLDEPCTNLDQQGIELYHRLINDYCKNRLVLVSSNDKIEYDFCEEVIELKKDVAVAGVQHEQKFK